MTPPTKSESPVFLGWVCIAVSLIPIARGLRLFPALLPVHSGDAPDWVILVAGVVFVISGLMILVGQANERLNHFLAALFTAAMGACGIWVSVLSPDEGMSGGLFFLSRAQNIFVARCVFGFGAAVSFLLCSYAIKQLAKRKV